MYLCMIFFTRVFTALRWCPLCGTGHAADTVRKHDLFSFSRTARTGGVCQRFLSWVTLRCNAAPITAVLNASMEGKGRRGHGAMPENAGRRRSSHTGSSFRLSYALSPTRVSYFFFSYVTSYHVWSCVVVCVLSLLFGDGMSDAANETRRPLCRVTKFSFRFCRGNSIQGTFWYVSPVREQALSNPRMR